MTSKPDPPQHSPPAVLHLCFIVLFILLSLTDPYTLLHHTRRSRWARRHCRESEMLCKGQYSHYLEVSRKKCVLILAQSLQFILYLIVQCYHRILAHPHVSTHLIKNHSCDLAGRAPEFKYCPATGLLPESTKPSRICRSVNLVRFIITDFFTSTARS